jgi:hypothetical protein
MPHLLLCKPHDYERLGSDDRATNQYGLKRRQSDNQQQTSWICEREFQEFGAKQALGAVLGDVLGKMLGEVLDKVLADVLGVTKSEWCWAKYSVKYSARRTRRDAW